MTLKQKFIKESCDIRYQVLEPAKFEQIADNYAIEFAEWADDNYFRMGRTNLWSESTDWENNIKITTNELLKQFKKEKYA